MRRLLLGLAVLLLMGSLAAAERGFVPQRRAEGSFVALVIGNGSYPDAPLGNPPNDATDVAAALQSFGFGVERLCDTDREQMAEGIARFTGKLAKAKAAVFYFAGHGVQVQGENWMLPIGRTAATQITDESQVSSRAVNAEEIIQAMERAKVPMNLVVLDACRNNPFKGAGRGRAMGLAELRAPVGSLILYATAAGKVAADGAGRNSPFTAAFLKHVAMPGLDVRLLPSEITNTVGEMTDGAQVPWQSASLKGGFYFVPPLSEDEKFAAEKARKEELLRQEEMQAKLRDLASQARAADAAKLAQLAEERKRVEAALATSQKEAAGISTQLDADLLAAREREQADLADAKKKSDAILAAKQAEITALDARIEALKAKKPEAGASVDLDALVGTMNERKARREELARLEREAQAQRAKASAEAEQKRKDEEAQATARRKKAEDEVQAQREQLQRKEETKQHEVERLRRAERQALADRLEKDLAKYRALASSDDGKDLASVAWATICTSYKAGEVRLGDEDELVERIIPGARANQAAEQAFIDFTRGALERFASQYPQHARAAEARRFAALIPRWASGAGTDAYGTWAKLVAGGQTQVMRLIPAGTFQMGSNKGTSDVRPVHTVDITQSFWLGDSEVTQSLWQAVMGTNPSYFTEEASRPVEQVSWDDCQGFLQKLNEQVPALSAHLPTEAQWEYACRAGKTEDLASALSAKAWYNQNSGGQTHPVKNLQANAWGLHDMHGNVREWCTDWYTDSYASESRLDPTGPRTGSIRVIRGGSWNLGYSRTEDRDWNSPTIRNFNLGFRLAAQTTP